MTEKPIKSEDSKGMTAMIAVGIAAVVGLVMMGKKQGGGETIPEAKFSNITATFS